MQVGYMRVSKADGSQVLDLQHDALLAAGVEPDHIYLDKASGSKEGAASQNIQDRSRQRLACRSKQDRPLLSPSSSLEPTGKRQSCTQYEEHGLKKRRDTEICRLYGEA